MESGNQSWVPPLAQDYASHDLELRHVCHQERVDGVGVEKRDRFLHGINCQKYKKDNVHPVNMSRKTKDSKISIYKNGNIVKMEIIMLNII